MRKKSDSEISTEYVAANLYKKAEAMCYLNNQ